MLHARRACHGLGLFVAQGRKFAQSEKFRLSNPSATRKQERIFQWSEPVVSPEGGPQLDGEGFCWFHRRCALESIWHRGTHV